VEKKMRENAERTSYLTHSYKASAKRRSRASSLKSAEEKKGEEGTNSTSREAENHPADDRKEGKLPTY